VRVIITSSSDKKLARATKLDANNGIIYKRTPIYTRTPDSEKAAMDLTVGHGVDQVIEVGGAGPPRKRTRHFCRLHADVRSDEPGYCGDRDQAVIDKAFGFDEVQAAYKHMALGAHPGKIVIRVAG
jgi:NADPH:quinone reductase-like Zn-dependent oxidoreductase